MLNQIGRYQNLEAIGSGGFGTVYRAHDPDLDRDVAIKVIRQDLADDATYLDAFRREARLAGSLDYHPNITHVNDFQLNNNPPYIVMEFVPDSLDKHLGGRRPLPHQRAVEIAIHVCEALEYSHSKGVIHRDIKPSNILLTRDGIVKVTDFGIARATSSSTQTKNSPGGGTPPYAPWEQWERGQADKRSDIYALGITLYEMITGGQPSQSEAHPDNPDPEREGRLPPIPSNLQIPRALEAVIRRATQSRLQDRFQDARAMALALQGAVARQPSGRSPEAPPPPTPPARIPKLAGAPAKPPQGPPVGAGSSGEQRRGETPWWLLFGGVAVVVAIAVITIAISVATSDSGGDDGSDGDIPNATTGMPPSNPDPPDPTAAPDNTSTLIPSVVRSDDVVYVISSAGGFLYRIHTGSGQVTGQWKTSNYNARYPVWNSVHGEIYIAASNGDSISIFDLKSSREVDTITQDVGWSARSIAVSPDGGTIYTTFLTCVRSTGKGNYRLVAHNPNSKIVISTITLGETCGAAFLALAPDGRRLYVSVDGRIQVYSALNMALIGEYATPDLTAGRLVASPDEQYLYIPQDGELVRWSLAANRLDGARDIDGVTELSKVVVSPGGRKLWINNFSGGEIYEVDASFVDPDKIFFVPRPFSLALSSDGTRLYVTSGLNPGSLNIIDLASGTIEKTIGGLENPTGLLVISEPQG